MQPSPLGLLSLLADAPMPPEVLSVDGLSEDGSSDELSEDGLSEDGVALLLLPYFLFMPDFLLLPLLAIADSARPLSNRPINERLNMVIPSVVQCDATYHAL